MFGFGKLLYVIVLCVNGVAVLSEDRFLNRIGWGSLLGAAQLQSQYGVKQGGEGSIKQRMVTLISATRTLMRLPLIVVNILIIMYELILG